jgi:hypothetical protein
MPEAIERIARQDEPFYSTVSAKLSAAQCTPKYAVPPMRLQPLSKKFKDLEQRSQALLDLAEFHVLLGSDIFTAMTIATPEHELNALLLTQAEGFHQLLTTTQADPHDWVEDLQANTTLSMESAINMMLDALDRTLHRLEAVLELPESLLGPQLKLLSMRLAIMEEVREYIKLDDEWRNYQGKTFASGFIEQVVTQTHFIFMHLLKAGQAPEEVATCPNGDGTVCLSFRFQNREVDIDFDPDTQLISAARRETPTESSCEHADFSDTPPAGVLTNALDWLMGKDIQATSSKRRKETLMKNGDDNNCPTKQELLDAFGQLLPKEQIHAIGQHLLACRSCMTEVYVLALTATYPNYPYKTECPTAAQLVAFANDRVRLTGEEKTAIGLHCLQCSKCLREVNALWGLEGRSDMAAVREALCEVKLSAEQRQAAADLLRSSEETQSSFEDPNSPA